ncbi:hypothetical protein [Streptomyces sp. NBC_00996]|uniref:SCO2400 family protein n=1 Tax=Streptomyces sp. NBC_00996 TaxID=2903710 RepID=UPI0038654B34|nr:hypothetical protein OG390_27000 [Streptomyces sp. NBC_00996]
MDYCSSCRRHLNGALVCPGCGAYAPDIAPAAADGRTVPARAPQATTDAVAAWEFTAAEAWHDDRLSSGTAGFRAGTAIGAGTDEPPQVGPSGDLQDVPPAPQGRAARRRQRARWKKNQRRAVVATAVALVGGGLTVAAMDRQSGDRAQAAAAPKLPSTGAKEEPTSQYTRPAETRPDTHRSSSTPSAQSPATNLPREQSTTTLPRTAPPSARPTATALPRTTGATATSAPQQPIASPSSGVTVPDHTGTAAHQTSAPAAVAGTDSGTQAAPTPAATSPSEICLLVVCIG